MILFWIMHNCMKYDQLYTICRITITYQNNFFCNLDSNEYYYYQFLQSTSIGALIEAGAAHLQFCWHLLQIFILRSRHLLGSQQYPYYVIKSEKSAIIFWNSKSFFLLKTLFSNLIFVWFSSSLCMIFIQGFMHDFLPVSAVFVKLMFDLFCFIICKRTIIFISRAL